MHGSASHAPRLRHVLGCDGLPIDVFATQLLHEQLWTLYLASCEQLSLEGSVDKELIPALNTRQRHVARDRTGTLPNSQVYDRTVFERLALRGVRCDCVRWCYRQLLARYLQLWILLAFVKVPRALPWHNWIQTILRQTRQSPWQLLTFCVQELHKNHARQFLQRTLTVVHHTILVFVEDPRVNGANFASQ